MSEADDPWPLDEASSLLQVRLTAWDAQRRDLRLRSPMHLPFGVVDTRPSGWLSTDWGVEGSSTPGWGEGATLAEPVFTDDSGATIATAVDEICLRLAELGDAPVATHLQTISDHRFDGGARYPTARLTVEMALLDAIARAQGTSVAAMTGVPASVSTVPVGTSIGAMGRDAIVAAAERAIAAGSSKIKLKVNPDTWPDVVASIDQLRAAHADLEVMVDANGTFDPENSQHLQGLSALDQLGLLMIEEPVSRAGSTGGLDAFRVLRSQGLPAQTPLCADDCLVDVETSTKAIEDGLVEVLNLKPGRIGSFLSSVRLGRWATSTGHSAFAGGMLEATPGRCMTAVLAAHLVALGSPTPGDTSLPQDRLTEDLVDHSSFLRLDPMGDLMMPAGPGWGFRAA